MKYPGRSFQICCIVTNQCIDLKSSALIGKLCIRNNCVLVVEFIALKWLHICEREFPFDMLKLSFSASETAIPFSIGLAPNVRGCLKSRRLLFWVKRRWKCALVFDASQHARYKDFWYANL